MSQLRGVYVGNDPALVTAWEQFIGGEPDGVLGYLGGDSWDEIAHPEWVPGAVTNDPKDGIFWSVPLVPNDGSTTADVAAGAGDAAFRSAAQGILDAGRISADGHIHIRIGWELNGDWFPWGIDRAGNSPETYAEAFRHAVTAFREVAAQNGQGDIFRFEWNVNGLSPDPTGAYPGDAYVDEVGIDSYWNPQWTSTDPDQGFAILRDGAFGLNWARDFAIAHGKGLAVSEWGVDTDGSVSDAASARMMDLYTDWLTAQGDLLVQQTYWDSNGAFPGLLSDGHFPQTAAEYLKDFGAGAQTGGGGSGGSGGSGGGSGTGGTTGGALAGGTDPDSLVGGTGSDSISGMGGDDTLRGGDGDDKLGGNDGNDMLFGGRGHDALAGGTGNDHLYGRAGEDTLIGGAGADTLTGGAGADQFRFNAPTEGKDVIADFQHGDHIAVSAAGFGHGLAAGMDLAASGMFVSNTSGQASAAHAQFVYETDTGTLFWDADGTGATAKQAIALLAGHPALAASDLVVIA